jgi:hypothetical protein
MRVVCTILLARGTEESIRKGLEYTEAATELIKDSEHRTTGNEVSILYFHHTPLIQCRAIPLMNISGSLSLAIILGSSVLRMDHTVC